MLVDCLRTSKCLSMREFDNVRMHVYFDSIRMQFSVIFICFCSIMPVLFNFFKVFIEEENSCEKTGKKSKK